ncbi:hypothetical protein BJV78DRAFT_862435 [Lactifluus subvellereus]|nr:hypothetical protein BJV78DRAFT_862435 [Lactifluus subvellereus]
MEDVAMEGLATEGDPTTTNPRFPSPELVSIIAQEMVFVEDGDEDITTTMHFILRKVYKQNPPVPEGFVAQDVFLRNLSHEKGSDFLDLVKKALREKDWKDVVIHDVFWTKLPTDSSPRRKASPVLLPIEKVDDHVAYSFTPAARADNSARIVKTSCRAYLDRGLCQPCRTAGT